MQEWVQSLSLSEGCKSDQPQKFSFIAQAVKPLRLALNEEDLRESKFTI